MKSVLANCSASITELKRNPSALIDQAEGEPIAILNHNQPTAYLVPAATYEKLMGQVGGLPTRSLSSKTGRMKK